MDLNMLSDVLHAISNCLKYPVIIALLVLIVLVLVQVGCVIAEGFTEKRRLNENIPALMEKIRQNISDLEACMKDIRLLKSQKNILLELAAHPDFDDDMREALAVQLIEDEQKKYDRRTTVTNVIAKLGPMFGLMGTLIPLGPGIQAMSQADTQLLSQSLLIAFDTTVAGLITAAVALLLSHIRKGWYGYYMNVLETLSETVLSGVKHHVVKE